MGVRARSRARSSRHGIALSHSSVLDGIGLLGSGEGHGRQRGLDPSQVDLADAGDVAAGDAVHEFLGGEAVLEGDGGAGGGGFDVGVLADILGGLVSWELEMGDWDRGLLGGIVLGSRPFRGW